MIEFITASHKKIILEENLLRSPCIQEHPLTIQKGFTNIPEAYNAAMITESLVCYVHHDVFLPESFISDLTKSIERLPDDWGVLGVAGVKLVDGKKEIRGHISDRGKAWGSPWSLPAEVDTLDEMLLITQGDLKFDEQFDLHFYGADICMQARLRGRKCFAISAYCEHNSGLPFGHRSQSFKDCEEKFRAKYIDHLPIATTCVILS